MAWSTSDYFPEWGDSGERPTDGFQYDGGDQVNEKHLDYFLNALDEFEDDVWAALEDIDSDSDGTVDDSDQFAGTAPSDGSDGQFLHTDGTTTSWEAPTIVSDTRPTVSDAGRSWVRAGDQGTEVYETDFSNTGLPSGLVVDDGVIYKSVENGVVAYDLASGSELWNMGSGNIGSGGNMTGLDVQGDSVYVTMDSGVVASLNASDGSVSWTQSHHATSASCVEVRGNTVYSCDDDGVVVASETSDGVQIWSHSDHTVGIDDVSVDRGYVYSIGADTASQTPAELIRAEASSGDTTSYTLEINSTGGVHVEAVDQILYLSVGNDLIAWDATSTSDGEMWSYPDSPKDYLHYTDGVVYAGDGGGENLYAYDAETGERIWQLSHNNGLPNIVYEHQGIVYYVSGASNRVHGVISDKARYTSDGDEWLFESRLR